MELDIPGAHNCDLFRGFLIGGAVLSEAARSKNPSVAMDSVVESLVSAGKGKDRRAKEILVRLFLLLDDGQGDTLFQGAPLSIDQQRQGASRLKSSLRASIDRLPERHE